MLALATAVALIVGWLTRAAGGWALVGLIAVAYAVGVRLWLRSRPSGRTQIIGWALKQQQQERRRV